MNYAFIFRLVLFGALALQSRRCKAQLTTDLIQHYLIGGWELCTIYKNAFYFDSDAGTEETIDRHDSITYQDSSIVFFADRTYSTNRSKVRKKYKLSKLLNAYQSPYKITLGETELIFEIKPDGFSLQRLILGTFDENESFEYIFKAIGTCK